MEKQIRIDSQNRLDFSGGKHERVFTSLLNVYTQGKGFNSTSLHIFLLLTKYFNGEVGYAWPTQADLANEMDIDRKTVRHHLKVLEEYRLINVSTTENGNKTYTLNYPVETLEEFYEKFPEQEEEIKQRKEKRQKEKEADLEKKRQTEEKIEKDQKARKEDERLTEEMNEGRKMHNEDLEY